MENDQEAVRHHQFIEHWRTIRQKLDADHVKMLAVSKYASDEAVATLIRAGERNFAESRPQLLRDRAAQWPECDWHMIGPVQKNKAKYIGRYAAAWHSCDDIETARKVAGFVEQRKLPVLIQVNIAENPNQQGVNPDNLAALASALQDIQSLQLVGLMGMAPQLEKGGESKVRAAFQQLRTLRDDLFGGSFGELCMGMSSDYAIAVEEGATMVRLGTSIFGGFGREQG